MILQINRISLISFLSATLTFANAQEIKKVSTKQKIECYTLKETYYVLKSDTAIRQGSYSASISSSSEKGQYEQGKKSGIWEYYNGSKLIQKYDFNTQTFITNTKSTLVEKITILDDSGNPIKELEPQNVYLGGDAKMMSILVQCIRYPGAAVAKNIMGKVHISAILTKEGKLINAKTESTLGYGLEEEAMRVFRMYPPDWVPVVVDGKAVTVKLDIVIGFTIS